MTTMDFSATLAALRRLRVETGRLVCFGCGHEHNCSTHGCAILRNAVEHMEAALSNYDSLSALVHRLETELKSEILSAAELRARLANEPLTCEGCACEKYSRDVYPCNSCSRNDETISDQYRPLEGAEDGNV